ncbi:MAG: DUF1643 domain-containing protein [Clostridia bacterium]|nr:DUF1643 domain-containing protein [Clostridia bacterium]
MGHVPKGNTAELQIPAFDLALKEALQASEEYDTEKWLYVPCKYEEYRYILATRGKKPLICIGINPSTARPGALDNTLKSVERIALHNGYDSFIMFNLYAQRATDPDSMEKEANVYLHEQNMAAFRYILEHTEKAHIWAAWGAIVEKRGYLIDCAREMYRIGNEYGACWFTCGKRSVKRGHPHHPLYLKKDSTLDPFELPEYFAGF